MLFKRKSESEITTEFLGKAICIAIKDGDETKELYSLFEDKDIFVPKALLVKLSEEDITKYNARLMHKMAVADKLYVSCREMFKMDKLPLGSEIKISEILAYVRKLDETNITWEDVYEEHAELIDIDPDINANLSIEQKNMMLQINLGSFEASCLTAAERIIETAKINGLLLVNG